MDDKYTIPRELFISVYKKLSYEYKFLGNRTATEKELHIKESTQRDTLDGRKKKGSDEREPHLNAEFVIAVCHKFDLDIEEIYFPKNLDELKTAYNNRIDGGKKSNMEYSIILKETVNRILSKSKNEDVQRLSEDYRYKVLTLPELKNYGILSDDAYMGTFYGYCCNSQYQKLDSFELKISKDREGIVSAALKITCYSQKKLGEDSSLIRVYEGIPIHVKNDLVYIVFNEKGKAGFCIFAFNYIKIKEGGKIFCTNGTLLTLRPSTNRTPIIESFVFMDKPIKKEKLHHVKSFLKLTQNEIIVPCEKIDRLIEENESVRTYLEKRKLSAEREEVYRFSERSFYENGMKEGIDRKIVFEALDALKEISANPNYLEFSAFGEMNKFYSLFLKSLQDEDE